MQGVRISIDTASSCATSTVVATGVVGCLTKNVTISGVVGCRVFSVDTGWIIIRAGIGLIAAIATGTGLMMT